MLRKLQIAALILWLVMPAYSDATWNRVLEVKGTATKQTDLFEVKGSKWRIRWQKAQPDETVDIYIYRKDGSAESTISTNKTTSDESYVHKSGTFYLQIVATTGYVITVEDWR